uniref:Uncharacterized protein n=1 Tax=Arundo donax TaxID=35708 RepID=A0A0A9BN19_ARUDO
MPAQYDARCRERERECERNRVGAWAKSVRKL